MQDSNIAEVNDAPRLRPEAAQDGSVSDLEDSTDGASVAMNSLTERSGYADGYTRPSTERKSHEAPAGIHDPSYVLHLLALYLPEADPEYTRTREENKFLSRMLTGLRLRRPGKKFSKMSTWLAVQALMSATVTILNIVLLIWYAVKHQPEHLRGISTIFTGNCAQVNRTNSLVHVALNAISSLFLGAANYCMQVLAAPSRSEVNRAHAEGYGLDIGTQSLRNLWYIRRHRSVLWAALGFLSIVLHLTWNSVFFASVPFTVFPAALATSDFLVTNDTWQYAPNAIRPEHFSRKELIPGLKTRASSFTRLDKSSCLDLYVDPLKANADLIIVAANVTSSQNNGSSLIQGWVNGNFATSWDVSTAWICDVYIMTGQHG
ncbi:hypothetical protein E8E14_006155 [Neopestalotiopsis sp. 37M]|nr:hypothetical protein E8E14_006155 [Neopestalotiopsis sp. 37M]